MFTERDKDMLAEKIECLTNDYQLDKDSILALKKALKKYPDLFNRVLYFLSASNVSLYDDFLKNEGNKKLPQGLSPKKIDQVMSYVNENLHKSIAIADLSALIGMSSCHFVRLFKASTGKTPYQYIIYKRMEKSKVYLETTDLPIIDIAFEVGYDNVGNFITAFKKNIGFTPYTYRKNISAL